ncbi:MAG TPA: EAL domain-containing protein [Thermoanaerobaculia bacterium]|jgi:diguanylate cyclase (GGDEF)-like protein/PAS domain S-box-containing protein|nr:EAL domain-containing protein [Thermoanaerobaculia bacterium]
MGELSPFRVLSHTASPKESEKSEQDLLDLRISGPAREIRPAGEKTDPRLRVLEQIPAVVWTTDRELRFTSALGAALTTLGLSSETLAGRNLFDHYGTRDLSFPPIQAHLQALSGEPESFEQEIRGRHFHSRVEPLRDDRAERILGTVCVSFDVTDRKQAEEALHWEKEKAQVTLASIGDGVIRADAEGRIDYLNPVAEKLTGWISERALGRPVSEVFRVVDEVTRQSLPDPLQRCLIEGKIVESPGHALLLNEDGKEYSVRDTAAPIRDRRGNLIGAVLVFKDVTQLRGMEREMIYLASHDALTGLLNRREFEVRLKRAIRSARAEQRHHVLLFLDLDEFKIINDTCGHLVGDEMLKQITALLRSRVRRSDILARLGGDEFGVLLEDCPLGQARQIAEEIRTTVRDFRFCWKDQIFEVGVSTGFVPVNADSGDLAQVMSAADAALYVAKDSGRNRVHEYEADDTLVAERYGEMQWIHRIQRAMEERRFRLFYQLIQPLGAAESSAPNRELLCEVFLRMLDSNGKIVEPAAFMSAAERYHLIGDLDRWVVHTAFRALAEAQRREVSRPVLFAVNVSAQSLSDEAFLNYVIQQIDESLVDPRRLCFEITETAAISKLDSAIRFISALKVKGCRFILDDFGSGLSSFAYLKDLSMDFLKIDGEFVQNMVEDRVKRAMVESINQIGHVMGLQTIAEWVENRQTLEALKELGVDFAQGYWLCRPQPLVHDS